MGEQGGSLVPLTMASPPTHLHTEQGREDPLPYLLPPSGKKSCLHSLSCSPFPNKSSPGGCWDKQADFLLHLFLYMHEIYAQQGPSRLRVGYSHLEQQKKKAFKLKHPQQQ